MVHHVVRTGASSRALGAHTAVSQPVNSDDVYASSDGCPSESVNTKTPAGSACCHCAGGRSPAVGASPPLGDSMILCAASETPPRPPCGRACAAIKPARELFF